MPLQAVRVPDELARHPEWGPAVRTATGWAEAELGRFADTKVAEWLVTTDGEGAPTFHLGLSSDGCAVSVPLDRDEVASERVVRGRVGAAAGRLVEDLIRQSFRGLETSLRDWADAERAKEQPVG